MYVTLWLCCHKMNWIWKKIAHMSLWLCWHKNSWIWNFFFFFRNSWLNVTLSLCWHKNNWIRKIFIFSKKLPKCDIIWHYWLCWIQKKNAYVLRDGWCENIWIGMGSDHGESHVIVTLMFHMDEEALIEFLAFLIIKSNKKYPIWTNIIKTIPSFWTSWFRHVFCD